MKVKIKKLHPDAIIPKYQTEGAAGFDLHAIIGWTDDQGQIRRYIDIQPGQRYLINTGLSVEIPKGYEIQIRPRSGLALKQGITVLNSPGTIDSDYRAGIGIMLINTSDEVVEIKHLDRIAQGVLTPVEQAEWEVVDELTETKRGEGGFGSTNK
jgi:dUTP pyrophosphatase